MSEGPVKTGWAVCRRACWWMSAEHRTGKGEEVLGSMVAPTSPRGAGGEQSIPSATTAGVRRGGVPRQSRGYTVGTLAPPPNRGFSQRCGRPRNPPRTPPETALGEPSRASSSAPWSPASRTARANWLTRHSLASAERSRAARFQAYPYPSGTGDRRFSYDPTVRIFPNTRKTAPGGKVRGLSGMARHPMHGEQGGLPDVAAEHPQVLRRCGRSETGAWRTA